MGAGAGGGVGADSGHVSWLSRLGSVVGGSKGERTLSMALPPAAWVREQQRLQMQELQQQQQVPQQQVPQEPPQQVPQEPPQQVPQEPQQQVPQEPQQQVPKEL